MRIKSRRPLLGVLMVVMLLCMTRHGFTQRNNRIAIPLHQARTDAQQDAQTDTKKWRWGTGTCIAASAGSCILGAIGIIVANVHQPTPPTKRFIGKSPQYITTYTKIYKMRTRRLQNRYAVIGCIGGTTLNTILLRLYYF